MRGDHLPGQVCLWVTDSDRTVWNAIQCLIDCGFIVAGFVGTTMNLGTRRGFKVWHLKTLQV